MSYHAGGTKRDRTLQLERLEGRNLLSGGTKVETIRGQATGTFQNVPVSVSPQVYETTIQGQETTQGYGLITLTAHDTTTVTHHGKRGMVSFTKGTGTVTDALGDEIFFTYSANGPLTSPTTFKINEVGSITRATGLFAGATGHFTGQGTGSFTSDTVTLNIVAKVKP